MTETGPAADPGSLRWRQGNHFGRHLYAQAGPEPSSENDTYIATPDTAGLAAGICGDHNAMLDLAWLAAAGFDVIVFKRQGPGARGGSGPRLALEHEDADEFPEFSGQDLAAAAAKAREWAEANLPARARAEAEAAPEACRGFQWIGQSFATCDGCGRPAWEHEGELRLRAGATIASPVSSEHNWEMRPWGPGVAEAIKRKWS